MNAEFAYIANDSEFQKVSAILDNCASKIGCLKCPVSSECFKLFNKLCNKTEDKPLKTEDRLEFEQKFKNIHKQLVLI